MEQVLPFDGGNISQEACLFKAFSSTSWPRSVSIA